MPSEDFRVSGPGQRQRCSGAGGTHYQPDFDALRAASTRVVVAVGAGSGNVMAGRAATAIAERLGTAPVTLAGGHNGFLGGEYGQTGQPGAFAATLRRVLTTEN